MTPWTALLESLHSALIDELTERHPAPKPTLGLPIRQSYLALPPNATSILICEFAFDDASGFSLLAFEPGFVAALNTQPTELWKALLKRAGSEFARRQIRPKAGPPREFSGCDTFPSGYPEPARVVWIPFSIPAGVCHLGLAV